MLIFALARRRRDTLWLLGLLVSVPLLVGIGLVRQQGALAEERYAWGGWYWLWPYAFSSFQGWAVLRNPIVWVGAWLLLWLSRRLFARRRSTGLGGTA